MVTVSHNEACKPMTDEREDPYLFFSLSSSSFSHLCLRSRDGEKMRKAREEEKERRRGEKREKPIRAKNKNKEDRREKPIGDEG